ncbi:MAG: hypothetical protein AAF483_07155 [Planctomycetota bacterium]
MGLPALETGTPRAQLLKLIPGETICETGTQLRTEEQCISMHRRWAAIRTSLIFLVHECVYDAAQGTYARSKSDGDSMMENFDFTDGSDSSGFSSLEGFAGADGDSGTVGLWRDGSRLVISRQSCEFPLRCVMTNEPISERIKYEVHLVPATAATRLVLALMVNWVFGFLVPGYLFGVPKPIHAELGLRPDIAKRIKRSRRIAMVLFLTGVLGFIGSTIGFVVFVSITLATGPLADALMLLPLFTSGLSFVSLPFLFLAFKPMLLVQKWNATYVWLEGADRSFLAMLPPLGQI